MGMNLSGQYLNAQQWPQVAINPDGCLIAGMVGTWSASLLTTSDWAPTLVNTTHADLDKIYYKQNLGPGTYALDMLFTAGPDCCKVEWYDGPYLQATQDLYKAGVEKLLWQVTFVKTQPISEFTLGLRVRDKNAASSDYYCRISGIWISRYI